MKMYCVSADWGGCGFYRILLPYEILSRRGHAVYVSQKFSTHQITFEPAVVLSKGGRDAVGFVPDLDVLVIQRPGNVELLHSVFVSSRMYGYPVVAELDDLVWNIPGWNPAHAAWNTKKGEQKLKSNSWVAKEFIKQCDAVTVSTAPLAEAVKERFRKPVYVLPNCLASDDWPFVDRMAKWQNEGRVTVGWGGSPTHRLDLETIRPLPGQVAKRVPHLHLYGFGWKDGVRHYLMPGFPEERVTVEGWFDVFAMPQAYAPIDIGLAPLYDHQFNYAKSDLKALEYGAGCTPTVAADLVTYQSFVRDGVNGFLCRSPRDWLRAIEVLATDHAKRVEMGLEARKDARTRDIDHHVHLWEEAMVDIVARKKSDTGQSPKKTLVAFRHD